MTARYFIITIVILPLLLLLNSCNEDRPKDLIEEDTYIDLIVEFELMRNMHQTHSDTTRTLALMSQVFGEYGVDQDRFLRSHYWYQQHLQDQIQRYRTALDRLNEITGSLNPPRDTDEEMKEDQTARES